MKTHLKIIAIAAILLSKPAFASSNANNFRDCILVLSVLKSSYEKCQIDNKCSDESLKALIKAEIKKIDSMAFNVYFYGVKEFGSEENYQKFIKKATRNTSDFESRWNNSTAQEKQNLYNLCEKQFN